MILWVLLFMTVLTSTLSASPTPDFSAFDRRGKIGEKLRVVFLGGSLTWGAQATDPQQTSYRALIGKKLEQAYHEAHFQFHDAAIGGTGSQLAAFRLERDVLAYQPDLVFLDFTINDDPYQIPNPQRLAAYESLVRRLIQTGAAVVQVILPSKQDVRPDPAPRPLDAKHKEIGDAYGVPLADAVTLAQERVRAGETTGDLLWDLPEDQTHPGDAGYALYADAVWEAFQQAVADRKVCQLPEKMRHAETYMTVNRHRIESSELPAGWRTGKPHRNALAFDFVCSRWMDGLAIAGSGAATLRLKVRASDIMLFGEMTSKSGSYEVKVEGGRPKTYSAKCAGGNMRLVEMIAQGLDATKEHEVEITPVLQPGEELRIESVCAAGAPATVALDNALP